MGLFFNSRKPGITPAEMKNRTFSRGVDSKITSALKTSGNSYTAAKKKSGAVQGVISSALASGYGKRKVAKPNEVRAGLDALKAGRIISEREYNNVLKAIKKELNN